VNFNDFFEKNEPSQAGAFRPRSFPNPPSYSLPDEDEAAKPVIVGAVMAGMASIILLSLTQGTLAWLIFESLEDFGFVDQRLPWNPFVIIALAVNLIRVFDRAAFGRR
jgi:hypothetical protein